MSKTDKIIDTSSITMDKLLEAQTTLQSFLNNIHSPILLLNIDGRVMEANTAFIELLGMEYDSLAGISILDFVPEAFKGTIKDWLQMAKENKKLSFSQSFPSPVRGEIDVEIDASYMMIRDREMIVVFVKDKTTEKRNETKLRESEDRFRKIVESMQDGLFIIQGGRIAYINDKACEILGYTRDELLKLPSPLRLIAEEDKPRMEDMMSELLEGSSIKDKIEVSMVHSSGERKYVQMGITLKSAARKNPSYYVIMTDTTERKKAELDLRESEERLALALKGADLGLWDWDMRAGRITINDRWAEMMGYTRDDVILDQGPWAGLIHPDDLEQTRTRFEKHLAGRTPFYEAEHRMRTRSGEWLWVLDKGRILQRDASGNPLRAAGTHLDITQRKKAEEELDFRSRLEDLIMGISTQFINMPPESIDEGIVRSLAALGDFMGVDRSYVFLFNTDRTMFSNTHEWCRGGIDPMKDTLQHLNVSEFHLVEDLLLKGEILHVPDVGCMPPEACRERDEFEREGIRSLLNVPMKAGGKTLGFIGFDAVRSQRSWSDDAIKSLNIVGEIFINALLMKSVQEQMLEERKRAEFYLDLLVHDIGNIHQGMFTGLQLMRFRPSEKARQEQVFMIVESLMTRALKLVKNVLLLSKLRTTAPSLVRLDLTEVVRSSSSGIKGMFPEKEVVIHIKEPGSPVHVLAEPILGELFFNLFHNGIKFQEAQYALIEASIDVPQDSSFVVVEISDHGPGITDEMKKDLFDRAKRAGVAVKTGIGLSLVKFLTERYGGRIEVLDRVEGDSTKGALFRVHLPLVPEDVTAPSAS